MNKNDNWRNYSLEQLENKKWGNPADAPSTLVKRCMTLAKIPVGEYSPADLRVMIGQRFGLPWLIPLALEVLQQDLFADTEFFEGDLLKNVMGANTLFWDTHEDLAKELLQLTKGREDEIKNYKIDGSNFYKSIHCIG